MGLDLNTSHLVLPIHLWYRTKSTVNCFDIALHTRLHQLGRPASSFLQLA